MIIIVFILSTINYYSRKYDLYVNLREVSLANFGRFKLNRNINYLELN